MHIAIKIVAAIVTVALAAVGGTAAWHIHGKQPVRSGEMRLQQLTAPVSVA